MLLKVLWCLCVILSLFGVNSQRGWGSFNSGYNTGFSNTWNQNNGFSSGNINRPFSGGNNNNGGSWGSNIFINRPNENSGNNKKSDWSFEKVTTTTEKTSSWNSNKPGKGNSESSSDWQSDGPNRRPNEKKSSPIMNPPSSSWNTNSNNLPSSNGDKRAPTYWGSSNSKPSGNQNSRPDDWTSNSKPSGNQNSRPDDWTSNSKPSGNQNSRPDDWTSNSKPSGNQNSRPDDWTSNSKPSGNQNSRPDDWTSNSNKPSGNQNSRPDDWTSNSNKPSGNQNSRPDDWTSNSNKPSGNQNSRPDDWTSNSKPSGNQNSRPDDWTSNSKPSGNQNSRPDEWTSNSNKPSGNQNSRPDDWTSNNVISNKPSESSDSDYEDNSLFPSWSSNEKKKPKPSNSFGDFGNWESTTQKNKKTETSKWETNNVKPQKPSGSKNSTQPGRDQTQSNSNEKKPSTIDTHILDELDKNDWYFGKESNYPKPPFKSTLNIDVSELWNVSKNKKPNQNSRTTTTTRPNSNYNRRRNRQIEDFVSENNRINCVCVNVNFCEEEDMIITQQDVNFDIRLLREVRCPGLTEVCCTNPKIKLSTRTNVIEEKEQLKCGQRRIQEDSDQLDDGITAEPGEFPWELKIENSDGDCSASLIHHKLALTAAHCVIGTQPDQLILKAGLWNTNNESFQSRKVTKIILHPDYNSQNPRNDIALLVLETPFKLTDNVNTICLPVTNDKWDSNQCVVSSWKSDEIRGQVFDVLEKGVVNFLPQVECQNIMLVTDLWRNYILHESFVCGVEKTGKNTCKGNEGGFVACPSKKHPNTMVQIGIISKGMNCDDFGRPGIFTNVLQFLDWINKNYFELELYDNIDIRSLQ